MSSGRDIDAQLFRIGSRGGGRFPEPGDLFESVIEDICKRILSPGDLALDGGAHVGRHTFPMAERVGATGLVLAIEAHPTLARDLAKRAKKRRLAQVEIVRAALSDRVGCVSFHCVRRHPAYSGIRTRRYDFDDDVQAIEVDATTVDSLLAEHPSRRLHLMKLDLEGGEFRALEGGEATLKTHRPLVVFENDQDRSAENYGYSKEEWFEFFARVDYRLFTLWGQPYGREDWGRRDIPWNFVAVSVGSPEADFVRRDLPGILDLYRQAL
ncbi:MAG TPA: FkbM family methyltransferase [Rhizomicrobium sp.]|nr:FkbM family methyltransferase [Rhizomicrobium sp.]